LSGASAFGLAHAKALAIMREVGAAVAGWREAAGHCGLTTAQIERMTSAFKHEDLRTATGARPIVVTTPVRRAGRPGRLPRT